jgi:hypothetical protein
MSKLFLINLLLIQGLLDNNNIFATSIEEIKNNRVAKNKRINKDIIGKIINQVKKQINIIKKSIKNKKIDIKKSEVIITKITNEAIEKIYVINDMDFRKISGILEINKLSRKEINVINKKYS